MGQYDAILDGEKGATAPATSASPYDSTLDEEVQQNQRRTRTVFERALAANPDKAAEAARLANSTGLAPDVVERNLDDVKRKEMARALDLVRMAQDSPVLARQLMDPSFTKQSHDDVSTLGEIEQFFRNTGGSAKAGLFNASRGAAGVFRAGAELLAPVLDPLAGTILPENPLRAMAAGFAELGAGAGATAKAAAPKTDGNLSAGFQSGVQSLTQNLLALPMAFFPGGQGASLSMMTATTGGQSYEDARAKGMPMSQALPFAASQAAIEYATEKMPLDQLIGGIKAGAPMLQSLAKQMALEIPGEQIATALQDMNEWAVLNPGKPFAEYIAQRPDAAIQTLVATVVGTGGNVVVSKGVEAATRRLMGDAYDAGQADIGAEQLKEAFARASASALRERNPTEFRALMQSMAENTEGAPQEIYVDAEVLNQLAPDVLNQLPEAVREALPAALAASDVVAIPVADALTVAPGTPLEQTLIEHARVGDPMAMTQAEAKEAGDQAQQYLAQEAQRVIQQASDQQAMQESSDRVRQGVLDQLNTVSRFRKDVNEAYATWTAAFYTTMAGRMGVTPEEMAARYPLRVVGQGGAGGLTQITPEQAMATNVQMEMPADPVFAEAVGNTPGAQITENGLLIDLVRFQKPEQEGAQAIRTGVFYLPNGSASAKHYKTGKTGYGGTERFAGQTLVRRPLFVKGATGGKAPEAAYDQFKGKKAYEAMRTDVLRAATGWGKTGQQILDGVREVLAKYGADPSLAAEIVRNSREGNTLPYAVQENIVAHAVRAAGYDAVVGYSKGKAGASISEVFDVREQTFPARGMDSEVHADFLNQSATYDAPTIDVDGVTRPAANSSGQRIAQTEEGLRNFWRWFGDSRVVDAEGRPLVVYHGTASDFTEFDQSQVGSNYEADTTGFFFTSSADQAATHAEDAGYTYRGNAEPNIVPAYLQIGSPAEFRTKGSPNTWYDKNTDYALAEVERIGADGVIVRGKGGETVFVAFGPTQIKSATGNSGAFDPADPNILRQGPRGTFNPQTLELALNENADLSTFLHESAHFFLEVMADLSSQPNAPADVQQDMAALLKWFGVSDLQAWNNYSLDQKRPYHERFAESFEQYLLEGKAPSVELQPLFRKFRAWMLNVYKSLKAFIESKPDSGMSLSDEVRQVFDRMLASEEQIAQAEQVAGLLPEEDATATAVEQLTARSLRDLKWTVNARSKAIKALQKQAAEMRKAVEAEVRAEVEAMPVYQAAAELAKLNKGRRKATDIEVATVADSFGFPDVKAMTDAIAAAGKKADTIEGMTDQRMLERHGDLIDQRAIEQAANEAVHNEARARSLATELKAQADMLNARTDTGNVSKSGSKITVNALAEAAKQFAANVISRTPLRDLKAKAWQHTAAERRAGKRWQEATAAGKTQDAVKAKQDQMLNNAAAKAAIDAQAEMKKIVDFFRRVTKDGNEKTVEKGRDPDLVNAARAILGAYGVSPKGAKTAAEYMEIVKKNDPDMYANLEPGLQSVLGMAQPLDTLTMEQLRGLHEEIQALWHLAKRSRQMEVDGDLMDIEDAETELQSRMQALGVPEIMPGDTGAITPREELARKLQHAGSLLRRVEQWAQGMGKEFTRLVFQPVKEAANNYRADRVKYRKAYQALVDQVAPYMPKGKINAPEINYTFGEGHNGIGMAELLHAILHTGNESNKRKLLLGRKWAVQNADGTLDTSRWDAFIARMHAAGVLRKEHYDFAQGVWDLLEQTKPLAQKTHRDVFGRYFAEVTADAFDTPFGQYRGGYVPAQADPRIVQDADIRKLAELENENMAFSFPTTNKGFTKGRVEYNRPLMLDLRTIGQHLDKVLLFAHMEPAVRDVNKLLSRKGVAYSLGRIDPTIYAGMLTPWLKRSATQVVETPVVGDGGISRMASTVRSRAGMALMFANVSNTLQQVTGFSLAALHVKPANMMRATAQFIAHPKQMAKTVSDASIFMADRMDNEIAAINEAIDDIVLDPSLYDKAQSWSRKHAYFLQTAMASTMEPIIWTAAYNQALEEGQSERDAVRHADSVIRTTQGSTLPEDVSRIETGNAYLRMFNQFIGYFNMMANTNATALKQISQEVGLKKGAGRALYVVTLGFLIPIWVAEAIAIAMRGGPDDEDDDGYLDDWLAAVFGFGTLKGSFAMVPYFGQLANAAMNRFNGNPADDKLSLSPAVSLLESSVGVGVDAYKAITDPDKLNKRNAVRDVASAVSVATGLPAVAVARPLGYAAGVADDRIDPTGPVDMARGLVTGTPSPGSR